MPLCSKHQKARDRWKTGCEAGVNPWKIGDGATLCIGSDCYPFTVVDVTAKSVTLREDDYRCVDGKDIFQQNLGGKIEVARFTKNGWRVGGKRGMPVGQGRRFYRDPSF